MKTVSTARNYAQRVLFSVFACAREENAFRAVFRYQLRHVCRNFCFLFHSVDLAMAANGEDFEPLFVFIQLFAPTCPTSAKP